MADDALTACCSKVYCDFEDMGLQPGREDWVRNSRCRSELVDMVRDVWARDGGGNLSEWPWNDDHVILTFIRIRKKTATQKAEMRSRMNQGKLFPAVASGQIYFLRNSRGHIKIGWTTQSPESRLSQIQTGDSEPVKIVGVMPGTEQQERAFHVRFAAYRMKGEWFHPNAELELLIKDHPWP